MVMIREKGPSEAQRHAIDGFETFRVRVNHRGDWVLLRTRTTSWLTGMGQALGVPSYQLFGGRLR